MFLQLLIVGLALAWGLILALCWLGWQLLRQNGRLLLRVEELEERLNELEFGESDGDQSEEALDSKSEARSQKSEVDQSLAASPATNGDGHINRFGNRSIARSKLKRNGLKAGTPAPDFRLPRLDGRGELALEELRGRRVLLVFSDPHCGPCNALAPELEKFHRENGISLRAPSPKPIPPGEGNLSPAVEVVMISKGEPKENRAKVKEHGLTFPIVLQQQWEISRRYAMFATPIAYLIDEAGIITHDVAVGLEPILALTAVSLQPIWSQCLHRRSDDLQELRAGDCALSGLGS